MNYVHITDHVLDVKNHGLYSKINVYLNVQLDIESKMENVYLVPNTADSVQDPSVCNVKKASRFKMEDVLISVLLGSLLETTNVINALVNVKFAKMNPLVLLVIQDSIKRMEYAFKIVEMDGLLILVVNAESVQIIVSNALLSIIKTA